MTEEDGGATSKFRKVRVIHEFNFFDESRTGPRRTTSLPSQQSSSSSPALHADDDATSLSQRVIHEFDFFDENSTGPRCSHTVPTQENKDEDKGLPPPFIRSIVERIYDPQVALLFEKRLAVTDVRERLNNLVVAEGDKVMAALTEEEKGKMEREGFLEVETIDSRENRYMMRLKYMAPFRTVVIFDKWQFFVDNNDLEEGDRVQGWGFRKEGVFHLAIY